MSQTKTLFSKPSILLNLLIGTLLTINALADEKCPEYKYKDYEDRSDILSRVSDTRKIGNLSLTGTRKSMTYLTRDPYKRSQELSVTEQLNHGVRVLDIAVHYEPSELMIYSSATDYVSVSLRHTLNTLFAELSRFLLDNPREFVIVFINYSFERGENAFNTIKHCKVLEQYETEQNGAERWVRKWSLSDSVGKHRGKILLATNQYNFFDCARMFKYECLTLDGVSLQEEDREIDTDTDMKSEFDHEKKWNKYKKFSTEKRYSFYPCYIYDLSNFGSWAVARAGDWLEFDQICIEPINYRIDKQYPGVHNSTLTILFVDYVTQEIIDRVNQENIKT